MIFFTIIKFSHPNDHRHSGLMGIAHRFLFFLFSSIQAPGTTPSTTTAVSGGVVPQSVAAAVAAAGGGVSSHLTTSTVTNQRQPQAVSASSGSVATPSDAMRQAPPGGTNAVDKS